MSTMTKAQRQEQAEAVERLREWLKPGDTVYCVLRHVSQSGMLRVIQLVKPEADGSMAHLGWNAAKALDYRYDNDRDGIKVTGAGMDMGFHLVYNLSSILFRGEERAGYLLNQRWI